MASSLGPRRSSLVIDSHSSRSLSSASVATTTQRRNSVAATPQPSLVTQPAATTTLSIASEIRETNNKVGKITMPPRTSQRGSGRGGGVNLRRCADLSALLTPAQKEELMLLVSFITGAMEAQICQIFDAHSPAAINRVPLNVANNPNATRMNRSNRTSTPIRAGAIPHLGGSPAPELDIGVTTNTQNELEFGSVTVQAELKREAVTAFQKWQAGLTKRVSEIEAAGEQIPQFTPGRNGRLSGRGPGRGGAALGRSPSLLANFNAPGRHGGPNDKTVSSSSSLSSVVTLPPLLAHFSMERRQLLLHAMLLLLLSLESYTAYSRVFLVRMAAHFRVPLRLIAEDEARVARGLSFAADSVWTEEGFVKKTEDAKRERRGRVPLAASVMSLATPVSDAKIGALVGGSGIGSAAAATVLGTLGTLADGGLATCIFFGMCGPRGSAAKTFETFTKDIQDVSLVPLHGAIRRSDDVDDLQTQMVSPGGRRLRLSIGISGWMNKRDDVCRPWRVLADKSEAYALGWEQETMTKVGVSLETMASSLAWQGAQRRYVDRNVLASPNTFQWPPDLLKISKIVDNPWSVGMVRADKVGIALADAIIHKVPGERGVSLLGYGLGARVIYTCLMSLSERRVFGLIENVIMMGTPAPSSYYVWTSLRSAVSGRVINVFSENDCMLGFLHRTSCIQFGVAGLQRIQGVYGIENVDATKPVTSHLRYAGLVGRILKDVGWEDLDMKEVIKTEEALASAEKAQERATENHKEHIAESRGPTNKNNRKKTGRRKLESQFQALNIVH